MASWFSADPHFAHANIIGLCTRPFTDVKDMDAHIQAQFQARGGRTYDLWVIGDFAFASSPDEARKRPPRAIQASVSLQIRAMP